MFVGFKKFRACINAMNGKITWQSLSHEQKKNVDLKARLLYLSEGRPFSGEAELKKASDSQDILKNFDEFNLYSLYSMAMIDAHISPATPEPWDPPTNPFILRPSRGDVEKASHHFKSRYAIDVSLRLHVGVNSGFTGDGSPREPPPTGINWATLERSRHRVQKSEAPIWRKSTSNLDLGENSSPFPIMVARSGTVERMYEIGKFKALLLKKPKAPGLMQYLFMFSVVAYDGTPVMLISSERNVLTGSLLRVAAEAFPNLDISTKRKGYFLCVIDQNGNRQNLGSSRDWENLEKFTEKAIQIAKEHLKVHQVSEIFRRKIPVWRQVAIAVIALIAAAFVFLLLR
jgi:hypothetical protein